MKGRSNECEVESSTIFMIASIQVKLPEQSQLHGNNLPVISEMKVKTVMARKQIFQTFTSTFFFSHNSASSLCVTVMMTLLRIEAALVRPKHLKLFTHFFLWKVVLIVMFGKVPVEKLGPQRKSTYCFSVSYTTDWKYYINWFSSVWETNRTL